MYYDKLNVHVWIVTGLLSLTAGKCALATPRNVVFIRVAPRRGVSVLSLPTGARHAVPYRVA